MVRFSILGFAPHLEHIFGGSAVSVFSIFFSYLTTIQKAVANSTVMTIIHKIN